MLRLIVISGLGHAAVVVIALLVYVLVTRAGHQRRHPAAAIGWVLGMIAFPYLSLPLFLVFGSRKAVRPVARRVVQAADAGVQLAQQAPQYAPQWALQLLASMELAPPHANARVQFHADGQQALDALLQLIGDASHHLDVCTYVLGNGPVGWQLVNALCQAAQRGVRVRLLLDGVGCWRLRFGALRQLCQSGVLVCRFMLPLTRATRGGSNLRDHRKLAIADGAQLWSGGRNLADEYFVPGPHGELPWVDLSFVLQGALANVVAAQFESDWRAARGRHRQARLPPVPPLGSGDRVWAQWLPSGPDHADDTLHALYLASAFHARRSITLVSPYFVPDDGLLEAWCLACRRGVRLRILIPARSNHRLADWARERALRALSQAGAEIHCAPVMVHAKLVIVDGGMALCGSANLDGRSLFLNYEAMTAFYGEAEVHWLAQWFDAQVAGSTSYVCKSPGWWRDLGEGIVRAIAFQL